MSELSSSKPISWPSEVTISSHLRFSVAGIHDMSTQSRRRYWAKSSSSSSTEIRFFLKASRLASIFLCFSLDDWDWVTSLSYLADKNLTELSSSFKVVCFLSKGNANKLLYYCIILYSRSYSNVTLLGVYR